MPITSPRARVASLVPFIVREYHPTPNPNALKCVLDRAVPALPTSEALGLRSYTSHDSSARDPVARALFEVQGVRNVLINETGWISIGKDPSATWESVKTGVERALHLVDGQVDSPAQTQAGGQSGDRHE